MKTITIYAHNKDANGTYSESIRVDERAKEQLEEAKSDFFSRVPFERYFYDVECYDDLTEDEELLLEELELSPDF